MRLLLIVKKADRFKSKSKIIFSAEGGFRIKLLVNLYQKDLVVIMKVYDSISVIVRENMSRKQHVKLLDK